MNDAYIVAGARTPQGLGIVVFQQVKSSLRTVSGSRA
jgi:hypothetical protein